MSAPHTQTSAVGTGRSLSYPMFAVIVVIYLALIQGGGLLMKHLTGEDDFLSTRAVFYCMIIPLGVALAFTYGVIGYLGWLRPVLRDDRPTRSWVRVVPIVFLVAIAGGIAYSALAQQGWLYVVVLLIATQFVGWGEEGMFRGIGVVMLREHGLTEGRVALWSSIIFGAVHLTNAISHGASALPQAIMVSLAGYFFYLIRRVTGQCRELDHSRALRFHAAVRDRDSGRPDLLSRHAAADPGLPAARDHPADQTPPYRTGRRLTRPSGNTATRP
ncbi:CPBP family intramembrane glutamic endopeptidase [Nocardia sp. NPDC058058]|uniref:CPBP family intramembrane glutamic endopeptidase n=1 Tax=Nocardia sp. NPDC058058 TaxID=3346317 RepID=UPI0036DB2C49